MKASIYRIFPENRVAWHLIVDRNGDRHLWEFKTRAEARKKLAALRHKKRDRQ